MPHDPFDDLMHEMSRSYNPPPEPRLDAMWARVERAHFGAGARPRAAHRWARPWVLSAAGVAAALALGIGIGRYLLPDRPQATAAADSVAPPGAPPVTARPSAGPAGVEHAYRDATEQYLGQTAALLIALPAEVRAGRADSQFIAQAVDLLATTRLLLDSPAASDPEMRYLLDDLELVLAQIARLPAKRRTAELDLITEALEQREVMPRLRSAAAGTPRSDS